MVKPYLRTEWGYTFPLDEGKSVIRVESALIAREFVDNWNAGTYGETSPAKVVQRSISDWGDDE